MAKTYLQANPSHKISILDSNGSIGGVWNQERLYKGLVTNNLLGTFEYSDFPMTAPKYPVEEGKSIPGDVLHEYLNDYARHFSIDGSIQLNVKVLCAELRPDDSWLLTLRRNNELESAPWTISTKRLAVASGMTTEPNLPVLKGQSSFDRPIFHSLDFVKCRRYSAANPPKRVAVLGSAKSAWDAAYTYAAENVHVDWIIRRDGAGPTWMSPPYVTPFKIWLEKITFTRLATWLSPCIWGDADGYSLTRRLLHTTFIGRAFVNMFWRLISNDISSMNAYDSHPSTAKLKPWTAPFWHGCMLSILNYPNDFFDLVRQGKIEVHAANIEELGPAQIRLDNGEALSDVDLMCCATGWKHTSNMSFRDWEGRDLAPQLGLPHHSDIIGSGSNVDGGNGDTELTVRADEAIFKNFPSLKSQPQNIRETAPTLHSTSAGGGEEKSVNVGYRLFRFMVPPSQFQKRNIVFLGAVSTISNSLTSQSQALWATAYFAGYLTGWQQKHIKGDDGFKRARFENTEDVVATDHDEKQVDEEMRWQTILHNRFGHWRYPVGYGARFPDFIFDTLPYIDLLLKDLGIERWRKTKRRAGESGRRRWEGWREWLKPYGPEDYKGLVEEWMRGRRDLDC
ncbi:MAG: hypothetical protein Q9160_005435 [Pyrenula sp. 1 TL-2023]